MTRISKIIYFKCRKFRKFCCKLQSDINSKLLFLIQGKDRDWVTVVGNFAEDVDDVGQFQQQFVRFGRLVACHRLDLRTVYTSCMYTYCFNHRATTHKHATCTVIISRRPLENKINV